MEDCIFCKIIRGNFKTEFLHQDDQCVAFFDIHPKAPVHLLIVPKDHWPTVSEMGISRKELMGHLLYIATQLAEKENLEGYKLLFNVGRAGGQEVFHVHLHLMGTKK